MILSIDPGDKRIGLARWTDTGELEFNETLSFEAYLQYLCVIIDDVSAIIVEDWRLRQGKGVKMTGSQFLSAQCIGAAKLLAVECDAELVLQSPQILHIAAMHFGIKLSARGHIDDAVSAKLHGLYWFENQGILEGHGAELLD